MRKHFLLIMLMSLFSLAGWSAEISEADITIGDVPYGTAAALDPFVVWKGETLTKDTHYTDFDKGHSLYSRCQCL